jgi:hypothetical protein
MFTYEQTSLLRLFVRENNSMKRNESEIEGENVYMCVCERGRVVKENTESVCICVCKIERERETEENI